MNNTLPEEGQNDQADPVKNGTKKHIVKRTVSHPNFHWWILGVAGSIVLALAAIWLIGSWQLRSISLNNQNITKVKSIEKLPTILSEQVENYAVAIESPDNKVDKYQLNEIGVEIDIPASLSATRESANNIRGRLLWWKSQPVIIKTKVDTIKLQTFIDKKARIVSVPVKDSVVEVTPEGATNVSESSSGKEVTLPGGRRQIVDSIEAFSDEPLKLEEIETKPVITKDTTAKTVENLNVTLKKPITFIVESKSFTAAPGDIAAWLILTPNQEKHDYDVSVDSGKVNEYINRKVTTYVSRPRDQVEVVQEDGKKLILVAGANGRDVANKETVVKQITDNLFKGNELNLELTISSQPFKTVKTSSGEKLIEVDTSAKRMYAFENNVLIRTFLISAGAPATPTVTGKYSIYSKVRSQDMKGFNADGSRYFQPNVAYVNYFYRDYAIHGNYWRPTSYFGNINSSHGCVGIVNADAQWIYNWAPIGTPVVIHS